MSSKMRIVAVVAVLSVVASVAGPAWAQSRGRSWWSGARSYRRPSPPSAARPRSPGERSPGERQPSRPRPFVIQFKHISAGSFMETMEQLAENEKIREVLSKVPHAVSEEANAVTFIAPQELAEFLTAIAGGLDRPNEFRVHRREMEMHERMMDRRMEELERGAPGGPRPPAGPCGGACRGSGGCAKSAGRSPGRPGSCGGRCGQAAGRSPKGPGCASRGGCPKAAAGAAAKRPAGPCGGACRGSGGCAKSAGRSPGKPGSCGGGCAKAAPGATKQPGCGSRGGCPKAAAQAAGRPPATPARPTAGPQIAPPKAATLLSPDAARRLGLSGEQARRIRGMVGEHIESMKHLFARVGNAMRNAPPEKRRELAGDLRQKVQAETARRINALNGRVLGLMAGEQRAAAMRLLASPPGPDRPRDRDGRGRR